MIMVRLVTLFSYFYIIIFIYNCDLINSVEQIVLVIIIIFYHIKSVQKKMCTVMKG